MDLDKISNSELIKKAEQDDKYAQFELYCRYAKGEEIEPDDEKAIYWCRRAADNGNEFAQYRLGYLYDFGKMGLEENQEKAFSLYSKSAEQGYDAAQFALGSCYETGNGCVKNLQLSFEWYKKAAEQDDSMAQKAVGDAYYSGEGVDKDLRKAVYWYTKSADQGDAGGQRGLARCYEKGEGVEKDTEVSSGLYMLSAKQGDKRSQFIVGCSYFDGIDGFRQDLDEATKWTKKSAEQGYVPAYQMLAACYIDQKTEESQLLAKEWYDKSLASGQKPHKEIESVLKDNLKVVSKRQHDRHGNPKKAKLFGALGGGLMGLVFLATIILQGMLGVDSGFIAGAVMGVFTFFFYFILIGAWGTGGCAGACNNGCGGIYSGDFVAHIHQIPYLILNILFIVAFIFLIICFKNLPRRVRQAVGAAANAVVNSGSSKNSSGGSSSSSSRASKTPIRLDGNNIMDTSGFHTKKVGEIRGNKIYTPGALNRNEYTNEVAHFGDSALYGTDARVKANFKVGSYSDGVVYEGMDTKHEICRYNGDKRVAAAAAAYYFGMLDN